MVDTSRLKDLAARLRREREMATSMRVARKRQLKMLPNIPQVEGYDFKVLYLPASTISGDFYDFIEVSPGKIGMAIGDVTGHGVEAGLVMGLAIAATSIFALGRDSAADVLSCTNAHLAPRLGGDTFFSASYIVIDTERNVMNLSRAGHNPPLLFNPLREPKLTVVNPAGMIIGVDKVNQRFSKTIQEVEIQLIPGDVVFQYTDGLSEASNRKKEEFGERRVEQLVETYGHRDLQEIIDNIFESVDAFVGDSEQEDDITMTIFKFIGREGEDFELVEEEYVVEEGEQLSNQTAHTGNGEYVVEEYVTEEEEPPSSELEQPPPENQP